MIKIIALIRSVIVSIVFIFFTLFMSALGVVLNVFLNNKKIDDAVIGTWAKTTCFLFNTKVIVKNPEKIPREGCLLLFNHSSFFDIFALAGQLSEIRFGAKLELFSIPVFGPAMRRTGTLPITRNNREQTLKVYSMAQGRFATGEKFALSPEGGRFHGENLSPFKAGPFLFAMSSEVPICPVVIHGAYETLPKGAIFANSDRWSRTIVLEILDPVSTKGYTVEGRSELQNIVYEKMNTAWKNPQYQNL